MRQHNVPLALASKNSFLELKMRISILLSRFEDPVGKKKNGNRTYQEVKLGKIIH